METDQYYLKRVWLLSFINPLIGDLSTSLTVCFIYKYLLSVREIIAKTVNEFLMPLFQSRLLTGRKGFRTSKISWSAIQTWTSNDARFCQTDVTHYTKLKTHIISSGRPTYYSSASINFSTKAHSKNNKNSDCSLPFTFQKVPQILV